MTARDPLPDAYYTTLPEVEVTPEEWARRLAEAWEAAAPPPPEP